MFIYKVTNIVNGKVYIGKTVYPITKRWTDHVSASKKNPKSYFHKAIKKWTEHIFYVEEIDSCCPGQDEILSNLEKYWIWEYQSHIPSKGYNGTMGGEGGEMTPEAKEKHHKNNPMFNEKHRKKHAERCSCPEIRLKKSIAMKKYIAEKYPNGRPAPNRKKYPEIETTNTSEIKEPSINLTKHSKKSKYILKGRHGRGKWTEEQKAKLSKNNGMYNPEVKEKHRAICQSEEYRKRMSEIVKARTDNHGYNGSYFKRIHRINRMLYSLRGEEYKTEYFRTTN